MAATTALLIAMGVVDAVFSAVIVDARAAAANGQVLPPGSPSSGLGLLVFVAGLGLAVAVVASRRYPTQLAVVGSLATATLFFGPTVALVGLAAVIIRRPVRVAIRVGALVVAATAFRLWFDLHADPRAASFWRVMLTPADSSEMLPWFTGPLLAAVLLGIAVSVGLWQRTRLERDTARDTADEQRDQVTELNEQVSRQAERERIAREIHDGVGHRLSLIAVHAGALKAMTEAHTRDFTDRGAAGRITGSAELIRESAAESMGELHDLIDVLRRPDDADIAAPRKTLNDVGVLVDEAVAAGMPLIATVVVADADAADPRTAQAVYRIVQELLTNARKHAPGAGVRLSITGGSGSGFIDIAIANHVGPQDSSSPSQGRTGMGLIGIRERVERRGGQMTAGVDDTGAFRVAVRIPWSPQPTSQVRSDQKQ